MNVLLRVVLVTAVVVVAALIAAVGTVSWLWQTRAEPADLPVPVAEAADSGRTGVTVTWLGISTLLFDDGETQILTDATFSRYGVAELALLRPLESDFATINYALDEHRIDRLAAIIPLHSHFDHAIDAGHVANRTGAVILGSESTANIARGSKVPVDQYQTLQFGEQRFFGRFTVTLLESRHVPQLPQGEPVFAGIISEPLEQPAPVNAWKSGAAFTVLIGHPSGTALVQGSAGFIPGQLQDVEADVALISIAGLAGRGRDYTSRYWQEVVRATGALTVIPIHFDDYTQPFGTVALFPDIVDDAVTAGSWLMNLALQQSPHVSVLLPRFGEPLPLY